MKTVKKWLKEGLSQEDYKRAEKYENRGWEVKEASFKAALEGAFVWADTQERDVYWGKIRDNGGSIKPELGDTPEQVQQNFYSELKALLRKYKAEISVEEFRPGWNDENKIVVDFQFDESLFEENGTGIIPQLILGTWEDGND